jgi:MinD-like ATPase involved in chromosome partitioning or flagellar assembly
MRINVGPTAAQIIRLELEACKEDREILRRTVGAINIGVFSGKGGPGKSTIATLILQLLHVMNPVRDDVILIDINTSQTNLDELNGLAKEDFLTGKYWTMETLYEFLAQHPNLDKLEFDEINYKLAYRKDPQLPVIPLLLAPKKFGAQQKKLSRDQYLLIMKVLKKFFTVIVHDFGTDTDLEITQVALSQLHMLALVTHSGRGTTKMVANHLEMLHKNLYGLLLNTVVVFNQSKRPSREAVRAIQLERAGKTSKARSLLERVSSKSGKKLKEIQTPGQAQRVINQIVDLEQLIDPIELEEIVLVGFDEHLEPESQLFLSKVSPEVQAHLWTALHRMLRARVEFENRFWEMIPEGTIIRREQMKVSPPASADEDEMYELIPLAESE